MSGGPTSPHGARRSTTRALLQVAAFAALQVIVIVVLMPVLGRLAAWFPPVYALVACTQTFLLFAARRFTGLAWGATLAAGITALVCAPFTPLGWLLAVPLMTAGVLFDLVLRAAQRRRWTERRDSLVSGVVVGAALFAVSLPVMSAEHLGPVILGLTLLARVVATAAGALLSARLVRQLERVGVSRAVSPR
ncbi:hypothetical protein [uncultured Microbacterium sp.]|uniref:hypothetical protein n=1 Tax=uncultured Microbacterium sp. TaxID=191216 RepID=UPI0028DC5F74|nr:hypothetical protein [uncultured Microbacterium sp.]